MILLKMVSSAMLHVLERNISYRSMSERILFFQPATDFSFANRMAFQRYAPTRRQKKLFLRHASQNESLFSIKTKRCFINLEIPQGDNGDFATLRNLLAKTTRFIGWERSTFSSSV